ncbi:MAG: hypothetical protein ACE5OQ_10445, partial [Woeseia sp.]
GFKALYAKAIGFGAQTAYEASDGLVTMHIVSDAEQLPRIDSRIHLLRDFGEGDLVVTVPRWGGFTEIVPKLAAAGVEFVEINGNDEIVLTTVEANDSTLAPANTRLLFNSMVISPEGMKRSVYVVQIENLQSALNSLEDYNLQLEHVFDF